MTPQERLRQSIDEQRHRLRVSVPGDREAAILALFHAIDQRAQSFGRERLPDLITGRRLANLGGNMALHLCLDSAIADLTPSIVTDDWAERFLGECWQLAEAELVLGHAETGFMRLVDNDDGTFDAWIASKRAPVSWQERADIDWWANWLAE
ncbi:MAG TPA: hypothetical protein VEX37_14955, partial [Thermomicrobiales bacterium]|nr:hypothetical protein [Thermomicrobiales bacterium]